MKTIDLYILRRYVRSFLITFAVLTIIFTFHTIWLFVSELAGKDIGITRILKFLLFYMPNIMYLTIPLSVIVSSVMTFGTLAEHFEFVALKSSGLSLFRSMRYVIVFMGMLSLLTFYIANTITPWAQYKTYNFRVNLKKVQPSLAIVKGVFSKIGDYSIKVGDKHGDNKQFLKDIIIHKVLKSKNKITIKAKEGEFLDNDRKDYIQLVLKDGHYYEDVNFKKEKPFLKVHFKKYIININISGMNDVNFDEERKSNAFTMLSASELRVTLDSLKTQLNSRIEALVLDTYRRIGVQNLYAQEQKKDDNTDFKALSIDEIIDKFSKWEKQELIDKSTSISTHLLNLMETRDIEVRHSKRLINHHIMAYNDKFSLALACIILFFTAAPFGAIIRKGGVGLPILVALIMFLVYYFMGLFSKHLAEDGDINPVFASWISNIVLFPIGVLLTFSVTFDRGIIPQNTIYAVKMFFVRIFKKIQKDEF